MSIDNSNTQTYLYALAFVHTIVISMVACLCFNIRIISKQMNDQFAKRIAEHSDIYNQLWESETKYNKLLQIVVKTQKDIESLEQTTGRQADSIRSAFERLNHQYEDLTRKSVSLR